jgi:hypothetical protein
MSNLKDWLVKRRAKFYSGDELRKNVDSFLEIVNGDAEVHEFDDAIIVLEKYGLPGNVRGWLLFDRFTQGTLSAIKSVTNQFRGKGLYASTHDVRIRNLLLKIGYIQYHEDANDYWLVYRGYDHGM